MASGFQLGHTGSTYEVLSYISPFYVRGLPYNVLRMLLGGAVLFSCKEIQKLLFYPILDLACNLLGVPHVKYVAAQLEKQPSFTHLGVLDKLIGYQRRQ